jgi:elongation factor G
MRFAPVFMGSAYKNKGVQSVLDGVTDYLPNPKERPQVAFKEVDGVEEEFDLEVNNKKNLVAFAFKLDENKFGQLTFVRVY